MCVGEQAQPGERIDRIELSTSSAVSAPETAAGLRVEVVDSWHQRWPEVLASIDRAGQRRALLLDADGWLSARQCLLVAFDGDAIAGHLVFGIRPNPAGTLGAARPMVEARLDNLAVSPDFDEPRIRALLVEAALRRVILLRCEDLLGLNASGAPGSDC